MRQHTKLVFSWLVLLTSLMFIASCGDEESQIIPNSLVVDIEINSNGSGEVSFVAEAINAVSYDFFFGDVVSETPTTRTSGMASHFYEETGSYTVEIRAVSSTGDFISISDEIDVIILENIIVDIPSTGYSTPESYEGMTMVWKDDFSGESLNEDDWNFEIGTGSNGWGNNELEYYRKENTYTQDGHLVIAAKEEPFSGQAYTSSRITTQNKQSFKYGRIDIRAVMPKGQGVWPALWMLGSNFSDVGWPFCGEIDIMEMIGGDGNDNTVHGTTHWDNAGSYANFGGNYSLPSGILADEFHVYTIVWDDTEIIWYIDDIQYHVIDITPVGLNEFQREFFFIFNVAVGGNWPGSPNSSTRFPQHMIVDYVRVFQEN